MRVGVDVLEMQSEEDGDKDNDCGSRGERWQAAKVGLLYCQTKEIVNCGDGG